METSLIFIGILLLIGSIGFASMEDNPFREAAILICSLGIFLFGQGVYLGAKKDIEKRTNTIPAIEVYRGKTTLQITYQDSVAIDSIVIYKKN